MSIHSWLCKIKMYLLFFGLCLISPNISLAQDSSSKPERRQSLSFEDELVEGSTQKPELFYLFQKKNFNYKRLIRLRENFLPEMRKTSEDLQRVRSGN
jgi:hypothetical protein